MSHHIAAKWNVLPPLVRQARYIIAILACRLMTLQLNIAH
jgi:hypothetical protein